MNSARSDLGLLPAAQRVFFGEPAAESMQATTTAPTSPVGAVWEGEGGEGNGAAEKVVIDV